ncbi:hypothetical protein PUN4_500007 [Paraburkholderia unamae]|nr:hypothetical protein PUN4_500007 [Paraburkholderia unamae]
MSTLRANSESSAITMGKDMDMQNECALGGVRFGVLTAARAITLGKNTRKPENAWRMDNNAWTGRRCGAPTHGGRQWCRAMDTGNPGAGREGPRLHLRSHPVA